MALSTDKRRRIFVHAETMRLGLFLGVDDPRTLVGWGRLYVCEECGFRCRAPGEIFDHALEHEAPGGVHG